MKQLNNTQTFLFLFGGILMVVGAGCCSFLWQSGIFSIVFLVGSVLFAIMQCMQTYEGRDITIRRLKRIMNLSDLFFVLAGIIMVETFNGFMRRLLFEDGGYYYGIYIKYIYNNIFNKWVLLLLIAAVLEVYTVHRISHELKKETKNEETEKQD